MAPTDYRCSKCRRGSALSPSGLSALRLSHKKKMHRPCSRWPVWHRTHAPITESDARRTCTPNLMLILSSADERARRDRLQPHSQPPKPCVTPFIQASQRIRSSLLDAPAVAHRRAGRLESSRVSSDCAPYLQLGFSSATRAPRTVNAPPPRPPRDLGGEIVRDQARGRAVLLCRSPPEEAGADPP